jgi:adenylate cyclase
VEIRWRIPISFKLVAVTVVLILATVVPIAFRNSQLFESSFGKSQQDTNAELAYSKSSEIEGLIVSDLEKVRTVTNLLLQNFSAENERRRALDLIFERDRDLVHVEIYKLDQGRPIFVKSETNSAYLSENGIDAKFIARLRLERPFPIVSVFAEPDKILIRNASVSKGTPLYSLGVQFLDASGVVTHMAVAYLHLGRLQRAFSNASARTLYLVDNQGVVLAHSKEKLAIEAANLSDTAIIQEALSKGAVTNKGQKRFKALNGEWLVGAYSRSVAFGLTVIVQVPESVILEPAKILRLSVAEVAGYVLSGALFFVILFSFSLTRPIEKLHEAAVLIGKGHFNIRAKIRSHDEVGQLAKAFNGMVEGLRERDKVKNILNKFHGSTVTDDLLKGDLNLGGKRKTVTVLFSDIRDFTKFSEGHTPEEVVEMLNEYFTIMVGIITSHHGIVDKFVGDAIMAVWGAPKSSGDDAYHAVKAALEMRTALNNLNNARISRGQTPIKIGVGLHSGPAISGTIGSLERMEYTVIGDTVNMASRIESSTKAFGADLLVSETVMQGHEARIIFEYAGSAEVKGKSEPIKMYKVRGWIDKQENRHEIRTPYSDYEAGHADKVKVAS